mmetsp:Transcript_19975/g.46721  ORF Transcript_19975/g.46721 Transcript_19975/m.46721 type:complete len:121 (-) Transcript_19975:483-845(-)
MLTRRIRRAGDSLGVPLPVGDAGGIGAAEDGRSAPAPTIAVSAEAAASEERRERASPVDACEERRPPAGDDGGTRPVPEDRRVAEPAGDDGAMSPVPEVRRPVVESRLPFWSPPPLLSAS